MKPYFVMSNSDAIAAGYIAADELDDAGYSVFRRRPDGAPELIGSDGGEPEDQILIRDWDWVVTALNAEAERAEAINGHSSSITDDMLMSVLTTWDYRRNVDTTGGRAANSAAIRMLRKLFAAAANEAGRRGEKQTALLRGLPLPKDVELLIARAKAWHEWRSGYGGLNVHATESDLFDAVEALVADKETSK